MRDRLTIRLAVAVHLWRSLRCGRIHTLASITLSKEMDQADQAEGERVDGARSSHSDDEVSTSASDAGQPLLRFPHIFLTPPSPASAVAARPRPARSIPVAHRPIRAVVVARGAAILA